MSQLRCSRADDAQAAKHDGNSCSGSAVKRGRGAWPRSPRACFRWPPLRLFRGMQEACSLDVAQLQAPQTLHRCLASYGYRCSVGVTLPFLRSTAPQRLFWARSTLALVMGWRGKRGPLSITEKREPDVRIYDECRDMLLHQYSGSEICSNRFLVVRRALKNLSLVDRMGAPMRAAPLIALLNWN